MKRYIRAASSNAQDIRKKISDALYEYIKYGLWEQDYKGYYKQIKKQFTVNGKKYTVKNDAKGRLHILSPEGTELYGYRIPSSLNSNITDDMALSILNDAYGDTIDLDMKKMYVHYIVNRQYHPNDIVYVGKYLDVLRRWTRNGTSGRYVVVNIHGNYSYDKEDITWFDNENEAISFAKEFIETMSNKEYKDTTDYTTSVIDSQIGEEIYHEGYKNYGDGGGVISI